jgi:hypothetical protein
MIRRDQDVAGIRLGIHKMCYSSTMTLPIDTPDPSLQQAALLNTLFGPPDLRRGQIIEISGPPASGKTSLCLHLLAQAQALGQTCAWIDADHTFEAGYAQRCGLQLEQLLLAKPSNLEEALDVLDKLALSGALKTIVVDGLQTCRRWPSSTPRWAQAAKNWQSPRTNACSPRRCAAWQTRCAPTG